jgi:hypothetical protein
MPNQINNDLVEPEERKNYEDAQFNPLDEAVNEKTYSQPNISASAAEFTRPIEEPRFAPPPMERKTIPQDEQKKEREPVNPEMREMPKKEKEMAAAQMAKMIIGGYSMACDFANKGLMISEKKMSQLQAEGEINLNAMIAYDAGKNMRAGDFFKEWNSQISRDGGVLQVSDEFKEEVTPVLERVLAKRGIGMTDEQLLIYMFGKDMASKAVTFFQMKSQLNFMIQSIKDATVGQSAPPPPPPPQPQPQPAAQQQENRNEANYEQVFEENIPSIKPDIVVLPTKRRGRPKS